MTYTTYEDACYATVSRVQAKAEIQRHGLGLEDAWAEFVAEHGDHEQYSGKMVLDSLGY